ncbi:hypothetical protein TpMuguga_04g00422 [Theileria parva strain Muguga]|uniref:uncharacterized protein n=1 Tax=Theileria parva strain Muguga TaxID=333668 RepID=UPI001C620245|nr:uncharacterized protein TpMuguga_04g00422 [Theileria parva strain Muguga]EAN31774.2 hypothetical protein TpMuguga_04g00422 [Theileria parva strain Muguga]
MILSINYLKKLVLTLGFLLNLEFSSTLEHFKLPLIFYGLPGRNISLLDSFYSLEITGTSNLLCKSLLSVLVHRAELYHTKPNADTVEVLNCTELIRGKCLGSNSCSVNINDCNALLPDKNVNLQFLNLQYSCEPSKEPRPIYDGTNFRQGIFGDFLIIPDRNSGDSIYPLHSSVLSKLLQSCLKSQLCTFVTSDNIIHQDDYFTKRDEVTGHVFIKSNAFNLTGYAVLLNFTAICEKPVYLKLNSFYEVANQANSPIYTCFSLGYTPTKLFNLNPKESSWLCRG